MSIIESVEGSVGSAEWSAEVRSRGLEMASQADRCYMSLASFLFALSHLHVDNDESNPLVVDTWGYKGYKDYAQRELGIRSRKAQYLRSIYAVLYVKLASIDALVRQQLEDLGLSKLRELLGVLYESNAEEWARFAASASYAEVAEEVTAYKKKAAAIKSNRAEDADAHFEKQKMSDVNGIPYVDVAEPTFEGKSSRMTFGVYPLQKDVVATALDTAGYIANSDKSGHLLTLICSDFLASNGAARPGRDSFREYLANLERVFGVRLVAVDFSLDVPNDVLYGGDTLVTISKRLAKLGKQ